MAHVLEDLGLTENEIELYQGFLANPNHTVADVARKINMDKSSAYRAVTELESNGLLISTPQKKGTTYKAAHPENLNNLIDTKKLEIARQQETLGDYISQLQTQFLQKRQINVSVTSGVEALKLRFEKALESKEQLIRERFRGDYEFLQDPDYVNWIVEYAHRRANRGVNIRLLNHKDELSVTEFKQINSEQEKFLKEFRLLPDDFDDPNSMRIWDDNVEIYSYDKEDGYVVIVIQDESVALMMKNMFDYIWRRSKPVLPEDFD